MLVHAAHSLPITQSLAATPLSAVATLAAARVHVAADPASAPKIAATSDAIQLYARVADRIEVATNLAVGRLLDVRG